MIRIASIALLASLVAATTPAFAQVSRTATFAQQTAAQTSSMVATGNSSTPYRYVRQELSWTMQNGTANWSAAEIASMQIALDKLPIQYLRHAHNGGMSSFHRDSNTAHVGPFGLPTGVAGVSPPFLGYVSLGSIAFDHYSDGSIYQAGVDGIVAHELGHQVEWSLGAIWMVKGSAFTSIAWSPVAKIPWYGLNSMNLFATDYGMTNPWEDFADSCMLYWYQPQDLANHSYAKYLFIQSHAFDNVPSGGYETVANIRGNVTPQIQSLSATSADPFTVKTINGNNWLSMWDGGYTHVTFGSHGAISSLCVSRQTIYAMVPDYTGNQPVKVTTPDGGSNQVGFNVNKPWYQFW